MKFSFPSFAQWRSGVIAALTRFPWNMLCGAIGAGSLILSIHTQHNDRLVGECIRLAMTMAIGMPLFFSLRMLRERSLAVARWPIEILGVPLLALWLLAQPTRPSDGPGIIWIGWLLLLSALHLVAAVAAYARDNSRIGFWQFNRRLFLRFCLATLYTGVLTVGLELALLSADKLFNLKLEKVYLDLWFLMTGLFHPAFFLAGVPRDFNSLNADEEYPPGLKAFTQFALAPLVAVYTAILYAYVVKIVITWKWPHGWVALPVLLLSGIGILAYLLLSPLRGRAEEKWATWFTRNFPRALAPLSILLLLSILVRINTYGTTEPRYLGIVLGAWIFLWSLAFIVRDNSGIRWIPASLAVIALVSAYGPVSAGAISKTSQLHRVQRILQMHGLWEDGHAAHRKAPVDLDLKDESDLRGTITYLVRTHGGQSIRKTFELFFPSADWSTLEAWRVGSYIVEEIQSKPHTDYFYAPSQQHLDLIILERNSLTPMNVAGFQKQWRSAIHPSSSVRCDDVTIALNDGVLLVSTPNEPKPQNVALERIAGTWSAGKHKDLPTENMTVNLSSGNHEFRLVFDRISFRHDAGQTRITDAEFYLLQK